MNDRDKQLKKLLRGSNHNIYGLIEEINALFPAQRVWINALFPSQGVCNNCNNLRDNFSRCDWVNLILSPDIQSCTEFNQKGDENEK